MSEITFGAMMSNTNSREDICRLFEESDAVAIFTGNDFGGVSTVIDKIYANLTSAYSSGGSTHHRYDATFTLPKTYKGRPLSTFNLNVLQDEGMLSSANESGANSSDYLERALFFAYALWETQLSHIFKVEDPQLRFYSAQGCSSYVAPEMGAGAKTLLLRPLGGQYRIGCDVIDTVISFEQSPLLLLGDSVKHVLEGKETNAFCSGIMYVLPSNVVPLTSS